MEKKIIIAIAILIAISIILCGSIIMISVKNKNPSYIDNDKPQDIQIEPKKEVHKGTNDYEAFAVENIVNEFIMYISGKNETAMYAMLDEDYKKTHNTQLEISNLNIMGENNQFYMQDIYVRDSETNSEYYVYGILEKNDQSEKNLQNMYLKVYRDYNSNTISIALLSKSEYEENITSTTDYIKNKQIVGNRYNTYKEQNLTNWDLSKKYISNFVLNLKYNQERAFYLLDEEYRTKKFNDNVQQFISYIENNKDRLYNIEVKDCKTEIEKDYIELIVTDLTDNIYIIRRRGVMEYSVLLDSNTI